VALNGGYGLAFIAGAGFAAVAALIGSSLLRAGLQAQAATDDGIHHSAAA